uniref:Uncharacterized protein n=1 Tax=Bactrocera dorsalis TaxID=27457 RepID=A0A034VUX7_BACDO
MTYYRNRHEPFAKHYRKKDNVCYCNNIPGLFKEFGQPYDSEEWRLFIDSNKLSLKAVLLHNGNKKPSIPIAHAVNTKETYEVMETLLKFMKYEKHDWKICADLKVVGMLCGLQSGYTKHCCFLCKWDSRGRKDHYCIKDWPERVEFTIGMDNIKYVPLAMKEKIILPPLHIKLGLIKNFVKALDKEGKAFNYLQNFFPIISQAKIKEGIFVGPQIKKLINNDQFKALLSPVEAVAWGSFEMVVSSFLGKHKSPNYEKIVSDLIKNYAEMVFSGKSRRRK